NQLKSAIVQAIPDLLVHLDREGRCLQIFNAESAQLLKKDFPPGTRKADVLPPDLAARWSEAINNCLATGQMQTFEQCLEIQGQQQYESVRVVPLDENSVLAVIRDETQNKLTQLALQESEARFRLLAENANDMISTKTPEGVYTYVSPACQTILGYTPEEMIGHSTYEFLHPEDIPNLQKFHQQLLQDNFVRVSHRIRTRNQTYVWVETSARLIRDPQTQNPIEIQAVVRDISERVAYETSLRLANQNLRYEVEVRNAQLSQALRYEELLRTISDRIRSNLEAAAILQTTVKLLGETLCLQHCQVGTYDPEALTFTAEFSWSEDTQTSVAVGIPCPINPISVPQLSRGATLSYCTSHSLFGRVSLLVCSIQDREQPHRLLKFFRPSEATFSPEEINLAERVAQQCLIGIRQANLFEQAQAQVKKLQELNRIKDDFLHMVSHELRTPLTNMKMALTMLKLTEDPNRREQYFQLLNKAWQQEYNLVNELLELQALESGSLKPHFQPLALGEWLGEIVEPFQERCRARHQKLVFDFQISLEQLVTDRHLLERIILELLNNACKYTPPHHAIFFKAKASPEAAQVVFEVINTGVTIPEAEQELIFKKFHRLPTLDHFNQGGTGLGLALVKKTVKVLGGQISLHSADQRTCFTVSVPQNPAVS
ncbi:MAG: PAS domain S-box protein, partial [Thermostichales cyanobacterium BF4_bins_65]